VGAIQANSSGFACIRRDRGLGAYLTGHAAASPALDAQETNRGNWPNLASYMSMKTDDGFMIRKNCKQTRYWMHRFPSVRDNMCY
jgi:hypothetical protein